MPTVEPLVKMVTDDEVKGQAKELFEQIKEQSGDVPKWMRVMGHNEDILVGFFTMFKAIMDDKPLEAEIKWKVAYRVSEVNKCEYCVSVSEQQLKQFGLDKEAMGELDKACTGRECIALEYAAAATEHAYKVDEELFEKVREHFNDEEIVELTSVVGLFNFINRFNDALGVLPDVE